EALAYAHGQGVLHRDVKPDNALVDDQDRLFLTDFGLAAVLDQAGSRLTREGSLLGTPAYMSPEQAGGHLAEGAATSDQYSAGVLLYELVPGRLPFEGAVSVILYHILKTPPEPPSRFKADLDPALERVCLKAMAKQKADRFPDCSAFAAALRAWLG